MKAQSQCQCSSCAAAVRSPAPERPRFFPRQLVTPADMTLGQDYFRDRLRRHNRMLHGWGVVCGALVCPARRDGGGLAPWTVSVSAGYVLGPYGDEIVIDKSYPVDLRRAAGPPTTVGADDPWCTPVYTPPNPGGPIYVAVKYAETVARPVRVQPAGCGCDATQCEYSRLRDGFEFGLLDACLDSQTTGAALTDFQQVFKDGLSPCPPCPADPWVVLAEITVDGQGTVTKIDNCSCRRLVISFANYYRHCTEAPPPTIGPIPPEWGRLTAGSQGIALVIPGKNFKDPVVVDLGPGITVANPPVVKTAADGTTSIDVMLNVDANATAGPRALTVTNPDCSVAIAASAVMVVAKN